MGRGHTLKMGKVRSGGSLALHPQPSPGPMASGGPPPGPASTLTERGSRASSWTQWVCTAQPKPGRVCVVTEVLGAL